MIKFIKKLSISLLIFSCLGVSASEGLISSPSQFSVDETASRFENILKEKGLTLFTKIDHTANAAKIDQEIRPTVVIIFGNPKVGTPLMQCSQEVAIDLPQKALIWEDESGKVWLSYNDPQYLKNRHTIENCDPIIIKIANVLSMLSKAATTQ